MFDTFAIRRVTASNAADTPPPLPLMTPGQASNALGITLTELKNMRNTNTGPKFHRLGYSLVRYNTADVMRWKALRAVP